MFYSVIYSLLFHYVPIKYRNMVDCDGVDIFPNSLVFLEDYFSLMASELHRQNLMNACVSVRLQKMFLKIETLQANFELGA